MDNNQSFTDDYYVDDELRRSSSRLRYNETGNARSNYINRRRSSSRYQESYQDLEDNNFSQISKQNETARQQAILNAQVSDKKYSSVPSHVGSTKRRRDRHNNDDEAQFSNFSAPRAQTSGDDMPDYFDRPNKYSRRSYNSGDDSAFGHKETRHSRNKSQKNENVDSSDSDFLSAAAVGYAGVETNARSRHSRYSEAQKRDSSSRTRSKSRKGENRINKADSASELSRDNVQSRYGKNIKKGASGKKKIFIPIVVALVLLLGAGCVGFVFYVNNIASNLNEDMGITNLVEESGPYYVLLLGGDSREDSMQDNRTDSIMVARIDEENKNVSLCSVPRDLRVNIKGEYGKVNTAIQHGGYNEVIQVVNDLLDIKISYYAFIYFSGFEQLVESLGGVNVQVPEGTFYDGVWVPAGDDVLINGKEALVLARCRHGNPPDKGAYALGDYQRTINQRNLIKAIGKKILDQDVTAYPALIESLSQCVATNMKIDKIVRAASNLKGIDLSTVTAGQLPQAGIMYKSQWYGVLYDDVFQVNRENFKAGADLFAGCSRFKVETNGSDASKSYVDGPIYSYTTYVDKYGEFKDPPPAENSNNDANKDNG
ncbi:MAG: LCP family protein [Coriobacteriales bacterium]|nr:LCP family protein [Coriobacteriales bacterium]